MAGDSLSIRNIAYMKVIDTDAEAERMIRFYLETSLLTNPFIAALKLDVDTMFNQSYY